MNATVEKILELMNEKQITATKLQNDLHLNKNALFYWKTERQKPSIDTLKKIAEYFNVSIDYLTNYPTYHDIHFSDNNFEWSAWYAEKTNLTLLNCSYLISEIKKSKIENEAIEKSIDNIIYNITKIFFMSLGIKDADYEDYKLIVQYGEEGYHMLLNKYNITQQDLNKLFIKQ